MEKEKKHKKRKVEKDVEYKEKTNVEKEEKVKHKKEKSFLSKLNKKTKKIIVVSALVIVCLLIFSIIFSKEGKVSIKVKSTLERIVEKSDLETVNFTYNVIAKQCKKNEKCDKKSNDVKDYEYVVSCTGTITAGIDFENVKIDVNESKKIIIIKLPEATIKETNVVDLNFLNGENIPADELPSARKLCQNTIEEKSAKDGEVIKAAKEQAGEVLQTFYEQWIKAFDDEYKVEVK